MSNEKDKPANPKQPTAPGGSGWKPAPGSTGPVAPLFRRLDWITFLITFATVMFGYYFTLAPELTLEDSGELAVGSMYAGIPHPPGYPVWTIYTWLWTVLLPVGNIAWRVALGVAVSGALAAGLLGLLVSRGSSLLMEGIEELKAMSGRWESAICVISGFVSGTLIGFNGFFWSQSVIVEVYAFSVASFMVVMVFLLRWIYAPHQRWYLYLAMFFFGISFTNHQTLVVAAMGLEVAIAAADMRLGRFLFLGNGIIYICGLILKSVHMITALDANPAIFAIFNAVGIGSIAAYIWFTVLTKETFDEFALDATMAGIFIFLSLAPVIGFFSILLAIASLVGFVQFARKTRRLGLEWLVVLICGICWLAGSAFYLYMPLAGMTNPPMQWGYPRTVEGFIHAFTRGQYEKANPTDIIGDPLRFINQLIRLGSGIVEEFNWVYVFLAVVPFLFFKQLHKRERAWLIGITAIYLCLGVLLLILLNPPPDRAAQELIRVFFGASHTMVALLIGYGMTLIAAFMATHYQRFRSWGLIGGAVAVAAAIFTFTEMTTRTFFGETAQVGLGQLMSFVGTTFTNKDQFGLPVYAGLLLIAMAVTYVVSLLAYRNRAPLLITLGIFALMPLYPALTHWSSNEQRNHWFGYWFGHDMFTPPFQDAKKQGLYPEMTKDAILFGGTDPGRFCPTYMIFGDSLTDPEDLPKFDQKFDRRDVYIITQNALADGTYLNYIRAHYNRSEQKDPPFFQELFRSQKERELNYSTNLISRAVQPLDVLFTGLGDRIEKDRRTFTSWFEPEDFKDLSALKARLQPGSTQDAVSRYLFENLREDSRKLLSSGDNEARLRAALAEDLNVLLNQELRIKEQLSDLQNKRFELDQKVTYGKDSPSLQKELGEVQKQISDLSSKSPLFTPERFKDVKISPYLQAFIQQNPQSHTRVRLNRLLLEAAYPSLIAASKGGVYPDREIYIPTPEDSQKCFQDYLQDAQRRLQQNQLKPGEDVRIIDNRVQVSGQVAVMAINGLLTKVIFDNNPNNEFFVEESFPLDWMYPYLTPYGIIMKINRQPLPELTEDIVQKDHQFWSTYSERLIGNWITYDTSVKEIADFVEKVYLRRDFSGFKGDRKFVRDDQAQKAFSKLRSSIGGVYAWRVNDPNNRSPLVQQRMQKEADFAFRQAFAFCPYSPEAVFRYVNLLLQFSRIDDALIVARTCLKLDPYNAQVLDLVTRLESFQKQQGEFTSSQQNISAIEKNVKDNPTNIQAALNLAAMYLQMQQQEKAVGVLDSILAPEKVEANAVLAVAQAYAQMGNFAKLENTLEKLVKVSPESAEAWYDLAALRATMGKTNESLAALRQAIELSTKRRQGDPKARDLKTEAAADGRFAAFRDSPDFKALVQKP